MERNVLEELIIYYDPKEGVNVYENLHVDTLKITSNSIECIRRFEVIKESIEWKINIESLEMKTAFIKINSLVSKLSDPLIAECDGDRVLIKLVYETGKIIEKEYTGSFSENGLEELAKTILSIIPKDCFYPKCIS